MRSVPHAKRSANPNLRGKRTMAASCGCCVWQDFRPRERIKLALADMREGDGGSGC